MNKKTMFMHYTTKALPEPEWHTIFSGDKSFNCGGNTTTDWIKNIPSNVIKFRATGSGLLKSASSGKATVTFTLADNTQTYYKEYEYPYSTAYSFDSKEFMKIVQKSPSSYYTTIRFDAEKGILQVVQTGGSSSYTGRITFTKIEALY